MSRLVTLVLADPTGRVLGALPDFEVEVPWWPEAWPLVEAGVLADRRVGRIRLLRADAGSPLVRPLTDLLLVAYGPKPLLEEALTGEPGIASALIVGSWAARYHGEPGPPPGDVDLVVIGEPDRDAVIEKVAEASRLLRHEVQVVFRSPAAWEAAPDAFTRSVRERPTVELDLAEFKGSIPLELTGGSAFPAVGELTYLLTLPAYEELEG